MSKRASQRKRGWVEFKGLQFAEAFMSRPELVKTIHAFFEEHGLVISSKQPTLRIRFSQSRKPDHAEYGDKVLGWMEPGWMQHDHSLIIVEVVVFIKKHDSRESFVDTLFHELDHCAWVLEGRTFDNSDEYWYRPHEVRARQRGCEWSQRLSR